MTEGRRHFHEDLDALQERLIEMAGKVEELVRLAFDAFTTRDAELALRVRDRDSEVDEIEVEIDDRVIALLALQQPMAVDLRQIVTSQKIANDLERAGDHAVSIAKSAFRLSSMPPMSLPAELVEMSSVARGMLSESLASYIARDADKARRVIGADDRVDDLHDSVFRLLLEGMAEQAEMIGPMLEYLRVSQNLERVGDLSTNIAEDVVFLVEGRTIKHGGGHEEGG